MRIGCLQINPRIGHLAQNVAQAEAALAGLAPPWDLLVLPELAFTGYNFRSLQHILPWLEDAEHGPSLTWARAAARRLRTSVIVGFPQLARDGTRFNSAGFVPREEGRQPLIYNKSHLYYTDERWAAEGRDGFAMLEVEVAGSPKPCKVAMGICMDLNPLAFRAPWDLYELATHALHMDCHVLVIPWPGMRIRRLRRRQTSRPCSTGRAGCTRSSTTPRCGMSCVPTGAVWRTTSPTRAARVSCASGQARSQPWA